MDHMFHMSHVLSLISLTLTILFGVVLCKFTSWRVICGDNIDGSTLAPSCEEAKAFCECELIDRQDFAIVVQSADPVLIPQLVPLPTTRAVWHKLA